MTGRRRSISAAAPNRHAAKATMASAPHAAPNAVTKPKAIVHPTARTEVS